MIVKWQLFTILTWALFFCFRVLIWGLQENTINVEVISYINYFYRRQIFYKLATLFSINIQNHIRYVYIKLHTDIYQFEFQVKNTKSSRCFPKEVPSLSFWHNIYKREYISQFLKRQFRMLWTRSAAPFKNRHVGFQANVVIWGKRHNCFKEVLQLCSCVFESIASEHVLEHSRAYIAIECIVPT